MSQRSISEPRPGRAEIAWMAVMQAFDKRIARRVKTVAKQVTVVDMEVSNRTIVAWVKNRGFGAETFEVRVAAWDWWADELQQIAEWFARRPDWLGALLGGEYHPDMLQFFSRAGLTMLPEVEQQWIVADAKCTCRDMEIPCRHVVSVLSHIAEDMDAHPLQAFDYMGVPSHKLLDAIHAKSAEAMMERMAAQNDETEPSKRERGETVEATPSQGQSPRGRDTAEEAAFKHTATISSPTTKVALVFDDAKQSCWEKRYIAWG